MMPAAVKTRAGWKNQSKYSKYFHMLRDCREAYPASTKRALIVELEIAADVQEDAQDAKYRNRGAERFFISKGSLQMCGEMRRSAACQISDHKLRSNTCMIVLGQFRVLLTALRCHYHLK